MNNRFCNYCGRRIPDWQRSDSRFCSDSCRKRDYDVRRGRTKPKNPENKQRGVV